MGIKNCSQCGKVFHGSNSNLCPECAEKDEENFLKVRNFIKDNPKVSVEVVVEATGVSEERIRDYLQRGRLDIANLSGPALECQRCGKPIYNGKYCVVCQAEISNTFKKSGTDSSQDKSAKVGSFTSRYRDRDS